MMKNEFNNESNKAIKTFNHSLINQKGVSQGYIKKYYNEVYQSVKLLYEGFVHGLVLEGRGGLGKSFIVNEILTKAGLKFNKDYVILSTYSTPLALYKQIYKHKNKLIILDDQTGVLSSEAGLNIVKNALWSVSNERIIRWDSTTERLGEIPCNFIFRGSLIFCVNSLPNNINTEAFKTRVLYHNIAFNYHDLLNMMEDRLKENVDGLSKEDKDYIFNLIKKYTSITTPLFSHRTLSLAIKIFKGMTQSNHNKQEIENQIKSQIYNDENKTLILDLSKTNLSVKEQFKKFNDNTGYSLRTFQRLRRELNLSRDYMI